MTLLSLIPVHFIDTFPEAIRLVDLYHYEPIKDIALIDEIMAVSEVSMCLLFVTVDTGSPERFLHLNPF